MPVTDTLPHIKHQLRTFGTLWVDGANSEGASLGRRRSLALLVIAAVDANRGANRDTLVSLLWPDSSIDRAASSFRQTLFALRKDLGTEAILLDGGTVRLNPDRFDVDVWRFLASAAESRFEIAADVYSGPFMEGFGISGLPGFARWAEDQRETLQRRAEAVFLELARRAAAEERRADAVAHWRRVVTLDRLSGRYAMGLLRALVENGERTSALSFARDYQALVRSELDTELDTDVADYVQHLRANRIAVSAPHVPRDAAPVPTRRWP